jgi:hypothetical protein
MSAPTWHDPDGVDHKRLRSERLGRFQEASAFPFDGRLLGGR